MREAFKGEPTLTEDGAAHLAARWATLRARELQEFQRAIGASTLANCLNVAVLCYLFAGQLPHTTLALTAGAVILVALLRFPLRHIDTAMVRNGKTAHWRNRLVIANATLLSMAWAWFLITLSQVAGPAEIGMLFAVCAGMIAGSATTMASVRAAGFVSIALYTLAGFIICAEFGGRIMITGIALMTSYIALMSHLLMTRHANFRAIVLQSLELADSRDTVQLLLNDFEQQSANWLWELSSHGRIRNPTRRFAEASGATVAALSGRPFLSLFDASDERDQLARLIDDKAPVRGLIIPLTIDGTPRWWSLDGRAFDPSGDTSQMVFRGVAIDVTEKHDAANLLAHYAQCDGLTDLTNRRKFLQLLTTRLARGRQSNPMALLYIDLDNFKAINDTLGHSIGDAVLRSAANRLRSCLSHDDVAARFGGDEFAILLNHGGSDDDLATIAALIGRALSQPVDIGGSQIVISASIGIARAPEDGWTAEALLIASDLALYDAKAAGRDCHAFYRSALTELAETRQQTELELRTALTRGEFHLVFQPLVEIDSGDVVSYEALVRWDNPARGTILPDEFIPVAEETGLIVQLGEWVIREAVSQLAHWPEHIGVSINVSPAQIRSPNLVSTIVSALAQSGQPAGRVELEITEGVLMANTDRNLETLHRLRALGIRIALDDFGTGYASFNYLRSFPFDKIKIDRCFVQDVERRDDCLAIIRAVADVASTLGISTTVEGIETAAQLKSLTGQGCTQAQGFYFSPPILAAELRAYYADHQNMGAAIPA